MSSPLKRYASVVNGKASARYLLCRSVETALTGNEPIEELWRIHEEGMERYRGLAGGGQLQEPSKCSLLTVKSRIANSLLESCSLCNHRCGVDRSAGKPGRCGVLEPRVASDFIHFGEEGVLVPSYTVFFAGCNIQCAYCQNHDISTQPRCGLELTAEDMTARIGRRAGGPEDRPIDRTSRAKNVNWVGGEPTPNLPFILEVLESCEANIAQVWNSNMYLSEEAMRLLDGVIDLYLTDLKFGNDDCARRLAGVEDYMCVVCRNHLRASAQGEVLVRHLVLPGHLECCTFPALDWLAENIPEAMVNVMDQYRPEHRAREHPELRRGLSEREHRLAVGHALQSGLTVYGHE